MAYQRTSLSSSRSSVPRSKFKEHLSLNVPPPDVPIETSRFSPESPPEPEPPRTHLSMANTYLVRSPTRATRDVESGAYSIPRSAPVGAGSCRDRMTRLWFDVRSLGRDKDPEMVPIQAPHLSPWPPLNVEKRIICSSDCPCMKKHKRSKRDIICIVILIIVILFLLANSIFLNVRVGRISTSNGLPTAPIISSATLSTNAQQCLTQYNINAPSDPSGYPCSSCLPALQAIPANFSGGTPQDYQQIQNAVQFCGLRAIFETSDDNGQKTLKNGGWVNDNKFCAWNGVTCDGTGRVSSLVLIFPGVPAAIPQEIGALKGLQTLRVVGNSVVPGGSIPNTLASLSSLATLHLEATSINSIPDAFNSLVTLELVRNTKMGKTLPSSLIGSSLQNLVINGQALDNPLPDISTSPSLLSSMKLIDLSSTSLSGIVPSTVSSFTSLVELHFDNNNLTGPLPGTFPSTLLSFSMSNNTGLGGSNTNAFCTLPKLQNCDMRNTGLNPAGGCNVCQF